MADSVVEFHAARLLLLFHICGIAGKITSLTKMAKLDFFVRYPDFFERACRSIGVDIPSQTNYIESSMVRYHYGPWDQRYYHVLAYLESRGLLQVTKKGKSFNLVLTKLGKQTAKNLENESSFKALIAQMYQVKQVFGGKTGSFLKDLVYEVFDDEVGQLSLREVIE